MRFPGPDARWNNKQHVHMYTKTVQSFESKLVPQVAGFVQQDDEKKKKKKDHLKINRRDTLDYFRSYGGMMRNANSW